MGLAADDARDKGIGRRRGALPAEGESTRRTRCHVDAEDHRRRGVLQSAFLDHQLRAALFAQRRPFLGRLEDQLEGAG
ncbi:hypothetical protein D3C80_1457860 [compost metagenome]